MFVVGEEIIKGREGEECASGRGESSPRGKRKAVWPFQDHMTCFGFNIPVPSSKVIKLFK